MTEEIKRGRGRPSYVVTEEDKRRVEILAAVGNSHETIAAILNITRPTLEKHYKYELEYGLANANSRVAANLFKQAMKDDVRAFQFMQFWLRCRAGWNEHGPNPLTRAEAEKAEKLGKKAQQDLLARNPDEDTPMGALMMKRRQAVIQ